MNRSTYARDAHGLRVSPQHHNKVKDCAAPSPPTLEPRRGRHPRRVSGFMVSPKSCELCLSLKGKPPLTPFRTERHLIRLDEAGSKSRAALGRQGRTSLGVPGQPGVYSESETSQAAQRTCLKKQTVGKKEREVRQADPDRKQDASQLVVLETRLLNIRKRD